MFKNTGDFEKLTVKLSYQFRRKELLVQALTTKSAWRNGLQKTKIGHHEEMAFFGDAILRMVVDQILLEEFPNYNIGNFSRARDLVVKNVNLSEAAKKLELQEFIFMDANQGLQCKQRNPKLLADVVEAIIYGIYKDSDGNLQEVKRFILSHSRISDVLNKHKIEEEKRFSSLMLAITNEDVGVVEKMLNDGFSPNFVFNHLQFDPEQKECSISEYTHQEPLVPLECAMTSLEKLAAKKRDVSKILKIIELLIKFGANTNTAMYNKPAFIYQLFSKRTYDGRVENEYFARFALEYSKKNPQSKLSTDISRLDEQETIPNWEKITDNIVELLCKNDAIPEEESSVLTNTMLQLAIIHRQPNNSALKDPMK